MSFLDALFGGSAPRVRIAPSPTGNLHIGTARTALFNYLFAKKLGGTFILRIEDTDKERSKPEYEKNIMDGLTWLGLSWDEFYRQSEQAPLHQKKIEALVASGKAYISKEPGKQDANTTVEVVRLKNPGKKLTFTDLIRGEITFDTTELGDFVIARSINDPLYHLAVVIDDGEAGVTHVIRGEDHISNTPRQILILEALGYKRPKYAHLPLILAPDRSKMSKRHGATSIDEYRKEGFIPEGLTNYLALLGWNPGTEQELFSLEELIKAFDLTKLQKAGAVFDKEKLLWFNREHLKRLSDEEFVASVQAFGGDINETILPFVRERANTLKEALDAIPEFAFLTGRPEVSEKLLIPKNGTPAETKEHLQFVAEALKKTSAFTADAVKEAVWEYATEKGRGAVLWPMRVGLTGREKSPDPFTVASILGKEETIARLVSAADSL